MSESAKIEKIIEEWKSLKTQRQKMLFLKQLKASAQEKSEAEALEALIAIHKRATRLLDEIKSQKQLETINPVS